MAFEYFVTENGRLIRLDVRKRMVSVLTQDADLLPLWQPIICTENKGNAFLSEARLVINDPDFPELQDVFLDTHLKIYHFTLKNGTHIDFLPVDQVREAIAGCNLPQDFDNRAELLALLKDSKTICQMASYVSQTTSTRTFKGEKVDMRQMPLFHQILKAEKGLPTDNHCELYTQNKVRKVSDLTAFAEGEIKRLDHWYVWNGRAKANAIRNALSFLKESFKENEKEIEFSPVAIARESGLLSALSIHRHGFFSRSEKAQSHQSLANQCLNVDVNI